MKLRVRATDTCRDSRTPKNTRALCNQSLGTVDKSTKYTSLTSIGCEAYKKLPGSNQVGYLHRLVGVLAATTTRMAWKGLQDSGCWDSRETSLVESGPLLKWT